MAERRPLVIAPDGCPEELPSGDTVPLLFHDFIRSEAGLVNQTTTLEEYLSLTSNIPFDGDYRIEWYYEWSYNSANRDFIAEVDIDTTVISNHRQEPKDVAGTGPTFPNTGGGNTNVGTNQIHVTHGFDIQTLTAGSLTVRIRFAGENADEEAAIHRGRISIQRVS